jgi:hypothetical protein
MNRVDSLVRQWCQNALKKKLFAMSVPTKSLQRARMMRHAQCCYQRLHCCFETVRGRSLWGPFLVHTFLRQRLTLTK